MRADAKVSLTMERMMFLVAVAGIKGGKWITASVLIPEKENNNKRRANR